MWPRGEIFMTRTMPSADRVEEKGQRWTELCIHEIFEEQARTRPEAVAVCCGDKRLTYAQVDERANRLAAELVDMGVGPEVPVALSLERSELIVIAILAVLKAGGVYVPVDLTYPAERVKFILEDTQAPVLLTQRSLRPLLPKTDAKVLCVDSSDRCDRSEANSGKDSRTRTRTRTRTITPENAAYIIYTSGSTGTPKGVVLTHRNVVRLFAQTEPWYGFDSEDVWTLFHSYAFDFSVWEIWGALFYGGRLVVVPYDVSRSPSAFYELLCREGVTVLNQTPSAFRQLMAVEVQSPKPEVQSPKSTVHGPQSAVQDDGAKSGGRVQGPGLRGERSVVSGQWSVVNQGHGLKLRYVIFGGEALELQSLRPWFERHGDERPLLVNMYGITETTVHVTYRPIRKADVERASGSVIGVPIPDLQIHLLDENLKPVSRGEIGEICVGGAGVARGYWKRPDLTLERFPRGPFSQEPEARLYRSGDLGQYSADGELIFMGRKDNQVKIRGFRIELGEIESALNRHPGVRESLVIAAQSQPNGAGDSGGEKRLVAYIVPVGAAPGVSELRTFLSERLPDYMIPAIFVVMKSFPLTGNGKVDHRALPPPENTRPELSKPYLSPRNSVEAILAEVWSEVLGIEKVGVNDSFFELGGDSIRSIKLLAKAQARGIDVSLQELFRTPTIAGLAGLHNRGSDRSKPSDKNKPSPFCLISEEDRARLPEDVEDAYPMSVLQQGMFYHNELKPLSAVYHDVFSFRIESKFKARELERAVERLVQRHPILRTSFHLAGFSQPLQLVHGHAHAPFTTEDLSGLDDSEQETKLKQWIEEEKRKPFDRTLAPLLRVHAQVLGDVAFQLIASFHHVCLDGWSLAAVITELLQDYAALVKGNESPVGTPRALYRDFIALERAAIESAECRAFWTRQLEGAAFTRVPRWPGSYRVGGLEQVRGPEVKIDTHTIDGLKKLARDAGTPLKSVLLAAHQKVMGCLYGQTDVVSGLVCNGRPETADGEKIIGLFLNTLPLRQLLEGGTWLDLVKDTFRAEQDLLPYRRMPLAEVQKLTGSQKLFEAAFDFVHFHVYEGLHGYKDMGFMEGHYFEANNLTTYTTFMVDAASAQLQMHIDYDPNEINRDQIEQITAYYNNTVRAMVANPRARYETFCPLTIEENKRLLIDWNKTDEEYPTERGIHELFEARARETPDAIAAVFKDESLTYAELDARANRIADGLSEAGVKPGALVGICLDRSLGMIAGLLGILKAGATYVPLDPAYPEARLEFMLQDCGAGVVLTNSKFKVQGSMLRVEGSGFRVQDESHGKSGNCGGYPRFIAIEEFAPGGLTEDAPLHVSRFTEHAKRNTHHASPLAYVIYTSGSTGNPKGVEVFHQSVVNLLTSAARKTGFAAKDALLAVTTLSFDIAALELFMPLIMGGRVVIASRETAMDGPELASLMSSSGATFMQATPATWRLLIESGWKGQPGLKILCGGEALKRDLADELLKRAAVVWNFYGPTETTIWSTAWKVCSGENISIGRPLANTQIYILDKNLQPVPIGAVGELHIGGDGLARGYLNRPELTAAKFVKSDHRPQTTDYRLYKTGDLARYAPDGNIQCLGRIDHQVKIRGFRIELGEIETVLKRHSGIAEAVVTARENARGESSLVAYLVSRNGPPEAAELREFAATRLPLYMVPVHFVLVTELPRTPNGKLDLKQLPAPDCSLPERLNRVAPRNDLEKCVASIWEEVLGVSEIGMLDNVFELGADSLSATRAFARINQSLGTRIRLPEIFEHPTVAALASLLEKDPGPGRAQAPIPRRQRKGSKPLMNTNYP
ncbi:MAG: hypothetical protein C5B50_19895 [Verrucomicrobia bacterium]|nr:MAG: hypothetical protein C5B50_19895 [Verrucomicrobiota bacterium]